MSGKIFSDWDETKNHIISESSKLVQKEYNAGLDWVGKVIHWEVSKKFKFDYTNKWNMNNPESVLENEMDKIIKDFELQMDHLISTIWPDLVIVNKKKKKEKEKRELTEL